MSWTTDRGWLEVAEYVSLAGSVAGSVAAVASQQVLYAAAPLTLALSLSLANRQQFHPTQQQTTAALADVRQVVQSLHHQVQSQIDQLSQQLRDLPTSAKVDRLDGTVNQLKTVIQALDQKQKGLDTQQRILHCQLECEVNTLTSLQGQVEELAATAGTLVSQSQDKAQEAVLRWASEINQRLQELRPYDYHLVSNRNESRNVLLEALESAQSHLIVVCPWLTRTSINEQVIQKFRAILNRNGQIDIGWGHLSDTGLSQPTQVSRQQLLYAVSRKNQGWKYNALPELEQLEQEYQGRFRLRLLGTHEKYLVCDRCFALLGSHNFLTSGTSSSEREVGLLTNDPRIIEDLIQRFERAENLERIQERYRLPSCA